MAAIFRLVPKSAAKVASPPSTAADLVVRQDEYATRVESPGDPRFWVRIEPGSGGRTIVTDFNPGARGDADLAQGLVMGLRACGRLDARTLVFRNLVPGGDQDPQFNARLMAAIERVRSLAEAVAAASGRRLLRCGGEPAGRKVDAVAEFGES